MACSFVSVTNHVYGQNENMIRGGNKLHQSEGRSSFFCGGCIFSTQVRVGQLEKVSHRHPRIGLESFFFPSTREYGMRFLGIGRQRLYSNTSMHLKLYLSLYILF